jgi:hypothetical protein
MARYLASTSRKGNCTSGSLREITESRLFLRRLKQNSCQGNRIWNSFEPAMLLPANGQRAEVSCRG